jgi:hypothetical protein
MSLCPLPQDQRRIHYYQPYPAKDELQIDERIDVALCGSGSIKQLHQHL